MKANKLFSAITALTLSAAAPLLAQDGWVQLFNGTNLDGWKQHSGTAKYSVQDGCIAGESVAGTGNSFLCPVKTYGDFELELEYQVDPMLNSGVQFRSDLFPEARTIWGDGKASKLPAGRLHGYQCEIDMDTKKDRWWTAGIYDEARRAWLFPGKRGGDGKAFTEQGRKISQSEAWNRLRIRCVGTSIKTWLNGEPRTDMNDAMTPSGHIGLQVHGIGSDASKVGLKVKFKNIRLREIETPVNTLTADETKAGWQLLWDGKSTDGWRSAKAEEFPKQGWSMKDGILTVHDHGGEESAAGGDIITRKRYANFELTLDFKITKGANSGIKFFVQPGLSPIDRKTGQPVKVGSAIGTEFQILDDANHPDAKLGKNGNRTIGSLYDLIPAPTNKVVNATGEWNRARIVAQGRQVEFWLNGQRTVAYERGSAAFRELVADSKYHNIPDFGEWTDGHILLQDHGDEISFRNMKIRELPAN